MATSQEFAEWLTANPDQKGTPRYATVLRGFQAARLNELEAATLPAPTPTAQPEGGFIPAVKAGATELGGGISALMGKLGLKDQAQAEKEYTEAKERAKQLFKPTEEGWTEAPWTKFKELLGGSLPYMVAPAVAAGATALLPEALAAAPVLGGLTSLGTAAGMGAAGLTSAGQFTATNLARQMEEGKSLSETELGPAAAAAIPQALLDTGFGAGRMMQKLLSSVGREVTEKTATQIAGQTLRQTLTDYAKYAGKTSLEEGGTEAAQQFFERLQAGLNIADDKARAEYVDNFIGGAILGGALAPAGRYVERGRIARQQANEAQATAAKERADKMRAEAEYKQTDAYLLKLDADFEAAKQQQQALVAALGEKPGKGADPQTKLEYKQRKADRDTHAKDVLGPLYAEYNARKADIAAAQKRQIVPATEEAPAPAVSGEQMALPGLEEAAAEVAAYSPPETATPDREELLSAQQRLANQLDDRQSAAAQAAAKGDIAGAQSALAQFKQLQTLKAQVDKQVGALPPTAETEAATLTKLHAQLRKMGENETAFDPDKAQKLLTKITNLERRGVQPVAQPEIPGMETNYFSAEAVNARLAKAKTAEERQRILQEYQQHAETAYKQGLLQRQQTSDLYADLALRAQRKAEDKALGEREAADSAARAQREDELVGKLVEATGAIGETPVPSRIVSPTGTTASERYDRKGELLAQLAFAQQTRNKPLETATRIRLERLGATDEEIKGGAGAALNLGSTAQEAGVEGALTPTVMAQNRLMRLAQRQQDVHEQLMRVVNAANDLRDADVSEALLDKYYARAQQLKQALLGYAGLEISGRRKLYGLEELDHTGTVRALKALAQPVNELIYRGITRPMQDAFIRHNPESDMAKDVPPAVPGRGAFNTRALEASAIALRDQFRSTTELIAGNEEIAKRPSAGTPKGPARRVTTGELTLFPTPAEPRVSTAPEALLRQGVERAASETDARLLTQLEGLYTDLTPKEQALVREQAQRAVDGKPLDEARKLQDLYQAKQNEYATATGQRSLLHPVTLLNAKKRIDGLKAAAEKAIKTAEDAAAFVKKVVAKKKTELEQAEATFARTREKGADVIAAAAQLRTEQTVARFAVADKLTALDKTKRELDARLDAATNAFNYVQSRYWFLREELTAGRAPKTNRAELATLERAIPGLADQRLKALTALKRIDAAIEAAKQEQHALLEAQKTDVVTQALLKEGEKAQARTAAAQKRLSAAKEAEAGARRAHEAVSAEAEKVPREPTPAEQVSKLPVKQYERVFKDTNAPEVRALETKKRREIAQEEGKLSKIEDALKAAPDDSTLQAELEVSRAKLQKLNDELADIYNNAPQMRVTGNTEAEVVNAERDAKRGYEEHNSAIDEFNAAHPTAQLALPAHRAGPLVKETRTGRVTQEGAPKAAVLPESVLEQMQTKRARLQELAAQLAYIKEHPSATDVGRAKQKAAVAKAKEEQTALKKELADLAKTQRGIEAEAPKAAKEAQQARKITRRTLREPGKQVTQQTVFEALSDIPLDKEQKALFDRAQNVWKYLSSAATNYVTARARELVTMPTTPKVADATARSALFDKFKARLSAIVTAAENAAATERDTPELYARGIEVESANLTAEQVKALEENDVAQALALISADQSVDRVYRAVAQRLADLLDNTRVELHDTLTDDKGQTVLGLALASGKVIKLSRAGGLTLELLLHEATHAAVERALTVPEQYLTATQLAAKRELQALHEAVKRDSSVTSAAAKESLSEFAAEVMSNSNLQQQLAKKPWKLADALKAFKSIVLRLIGIKDTASMLGASMKAVDALFLPTSTQSFTEQSGAVAAVSPAADTRALFARPATYSPAMSDAGKTADKLIPRSKTLRDKVAANLGLAFRAQNVDKAAPLETALREGVSHGSIEDFQASQAMFYVRAWEHRSHMLSQAISVGAPELRQLTRKDGQKEYVIEANKGATIKDMVDVLKDKSVAKAAGSPDAASNLLTLYMASIRADRVGYNKLTFGQAAAKAELVQIERELASPKTTAEDVPRLQKRKRYLEDRVDQMPSEAEIKAARAEIEASPVLKDAFDKARAIYNEYNRNLLHFLVQTGYLSEGKAKELLAQDDYIPYYRIRGGNAELIIGGETPVRLGNLKDSPHLDELVGGEEPIMNIINSSVQNTSMLLDAGMKNLAQKESMWALAKAGLAVIRPGDGPQHAVTFRKDGAMWHAIVDTDHVGVPSDLLVRGLAGIPTMLPAGLRMMGTPARLLRRMVVASPMYMGRQLVRDSLGSFIGSGSNAAPIFSTLRNIGKDSVLERRGVTGGQVFSGMPDDIARMLKQMQAGKVGWTNAFAKLEAMSMEVDAANRRAQYQSYIDQGLSEMEATLASIESMNFMRRGISPGMHYASTLIPFLNAQIQSLDTLYRAFKGTMPFNDKLKIQEKLLTRGALLATTSLLYAMASNDDDDDYYKNASPEQKYGNWLVRLPSLDKYAGEKVVVRVPVPFELGYIFKSLPEAVYNTVANKHGGEEAAEAFKQIALNVIPGGTAYGIPAAVKPLVEVGLGKSFFTGRDLESVQEQKQEAGTRYRDNTTEAAKFVGSALNVSPIKLEALINGYTGSMGLALVSALNPIFPSKERVQAAKRLSDLPLVGTSFQPDDASGIIDAVYKTLQEASQAQASYKALVERGEIKQAEAFLQSRMQELMLAPLAGKYTEEMGKLAKERRQIQGADMDAETKRKAIDNIKQMQINIANYVRGVVDKTKAQSARP